MSVTAQSFPRSLRRSGDSRRVSEKSVLLTLSRKLTCTEPMLSTDTAPSILDVMADPRYFGAWFAASTWLAWRAFLAGAFGLSMTEELAAMWQQCTRRRPPGTAVREVALVCGRRAGKSRVAALIAVYLACFRDYTPHLAPGEFATLPIVAADRREARTVMRYVKAFLDVPALRARVVQPLAESVELTGRVQIEVHTAGFRAVRGYTVMGAICDEIAFWNTATDSANPDTEVLAALRPGMASIPGAMLVLLSSPYARSGVLWDTYDRYFGRDDSNVVVWQADTRTMNPTIDPARLLETPARRRLTSSSRLSRRRGEWLGAGQCSARVRTREEHQERSGTVLPIDDEWWTTNTPPLDVNCRCWTVEHTEGSLQRYGLDVTEAPDIPDVEYEHPKTRERITVPEGVQPGFGRDLALVALLETRTHRNPDRTVSYTGAAQAFRLSRRHVVRVAKQNPLG
jgi:hypothetical protein